MAINIGTGLQVNAGVPLDVKFFNESVQPYTATTEVTTTIPLAQRHIGLTVLVDDGSGPEEYWFATGVTNSDLVVKSPDIAAAGGLTGATNGLTSTGAVVALGGSLTGNTTIDLNNSDITFNNGSLGDTSSFAVCLLNFDGNSGGQDITLRNIYQTSGAQDESEIRLEDGVLILRGLQDDTLGTGDGSSLRLGTQSAELGIFTNTDIDNNRYSDTFVKGITIPRSPVQYIDVLDPDGNGFQYLDDYSPNNTGANENLRWIPDLGAVKDVVSSSAVTATNGLTLNGANEVVLGGTLTGDTQVASGGFGLVFGAGSATGDTGFSIGNSNAGGANSFAGGTSTANGANTFAFGDGHTNNGANGSAILGGAGSTLDAGTNWTVALGEAMCANTTGGGNVNNAIFAGGYQNTICTAGSNKFNVFIGGGQNSVVSGTSVFGHATSLGRANLIQANRGTAIGERAQVTGLGGVAIGLMQGSNGVNPANNERVLASGAHSINISVNSASQTAGHGAEADGSAIFGGRDGHIATGNDRAVIVGGDAIKLTGATDYTDHTVVDNLAIYSQPTTNPSGEILVRGTDGIVGVTTIASIGGITGATNGLTVSGSDVILGGGLDQNTTIDGGSGTYSLNMVDLSSSCISVSGSSSELALDAQNNGQVIIKSQSGTAASDDFTNSIGFNLDFNNGLFRVTDNRATASGLQYTDDYSANFTDRSIPDVEYVNNVAAGLDAKNAANVATTANIDLTGGTFGGSIDGITVLDGWRVLVKDQTTLSQNGIYDYVASASTFTRSNDFDGTPANEVTSGALVAVITGDTNSNTKWIVTSPDPITVDTDDITFSFFSSDLQIQASSGITITNGDTIAVDLAGTSSLSFDGGLGLRVDSSIAGSGLTYNTGVVDVNASATAIAGTEIPVKFGTGNALFLDSADVNSSLGGAITAATNGLTAAAGTVCLGGTLITNTSVDGASSYSMNFTQTCAFIVNGAATGQYGIALGLGTSAAGACSVVFGYGSSTNASGGYAVAGGRNASANASSAVAIGYNASATSSNASAFGYASNASGSGAVAVGYNTSAGGACSVALAGSSTTGTVSFAAAGGNAGGNCGVALSEGTTSANGSTAIGNGSSAGGVNSIAFIGGTTNSACAFALGESAQAYAACGIAIGNSAQVQSGNGVAIGYNSYVSSSSVNGVAIAGGQACANNAVAINTSSQGYAQYSVAVAQGTTCGECSFAAGAGSTTYAANSTALNGAITYGSGSFAAGASSAACYDNSVALGYSTLACAIYSLAAGAYSQTFGNGSIALGCSAIACGIASLATGYRTEAYGACSFAGGVGTSSRPIRAYGAGSFNWSTNTNSQGANCGAQGARSVILGGCNHNIALAYSNAAIIGGSDINLDGNNYDDTVAVSCLAIFSTPDTGATGDTVLVLDAADNKVKAVSQSSITGQVPTTSAGNGLTNDNGTIILGGTLTGNTQVNPNGNGISLGGGTATGANSFAAAYGNARAYNSFALGSFSYSCSNGAGGLNAAVACGDYSLAINNARTYGQDSFAGNRGRACGQGSFAFGNFQSGGKGTYACGTNSVIISNNTVAQTAGHGANANYSAILGGIDHNIESGNVRSTIIGGSAIKLTGTTYTDTVAVDCLAIFSTPDTGASGDTVLVLDAADNKVKAVTQASIVGTPPNLQTVLDAGSAASTTDDGSDELSILYAIDGSQVIGVGSTSNSISSRSTDGASNESRSEFAQIRTSIPTSNTVASDNEFTSFTGSSQSAASTVAAIKTLAHVNRVSQVGSDDITASFIGLYTGTTDFAAGLIVREDAGVVSSLFRDDINSRGLEYEADYSANYNDRTLVDKEYVDSQTSGGTNNQYVRQFVTGATTLGSSDFVTLVSTTGGTVTVTLPASPVAGQVYYIKDTGNALTNNITIAGNGNNIDGAATATINTDFGAVQLVYDDFLGEWFVLSFNN
jgi:hypothetical protein